MALDPQVKVAPSAGAEAEARMSSESLRPPEKAAEKRETVLEILKEEKKEQQIFKGQAFKYRNICKSITGHLCGYVKHNRDDLMRVLQEAGFSISDCEHALYRLSYDYDNKNRKEKIKMSQNMIMRFLATKSIYTYILREATNTMLYNWRVGKYGKIVAKNRALYAEACEAIYHEAVKVSGESARGNSFVL